jgi:hypothetical protein
MPDMSTAPEQPQYLASLCRRALAEYGTRAPWNKRELEEPTPADALVVARALRMEGNRDVRRLVAFAPRCRVIHPAKMARSII